MDSIFISLRGTGFKIESIPHHKLVDTHTHICDSSFDADRGEVLDRAADAGVAAVIAVGENIADARRNIELADKHPMIYPAAGLYPTILDLDQAEQMRSFIRSERLKLVAIGEVGLDFWVVKEEPQKEIQKEILKGFINLAKKLDLPLNIHSRSAGRHAVALLLECGPTRVQMHAFDGKASAALPAKATFGLRSDRKKLLVTGPNLFGSLELEIWILFVICYLVLGILIFKDAIIFRYAFRLF